MESGRGGFTRSGRGGGRPRGETCARGGFTLAEVIFAVVILFVLSAFAFPRVREMTLRSSLQTAAEHFAAELGAIRAEAVKRNAPIAVAFHPPADYRVEHLGPRRLDGARFVLAPDTVRFGPFGPPLTGGATFVLAAGEFEATVVLTGSGFARVE